MRVGRSPRTGITGIVLFGLLASCATLDPPTSDLPDAPAPETAPTPDSATGLALQADRHYEAGEFDRAAALYEEALEAGFPPGHETEETALFRLAVLRLRDGTSSGSARRLLERLVASHPDGAYLAPAEALLAREREIARLRGQIEALKRIDLQDGNR